MTSFAVTYFDEMYQRSDDPWDYRGRWYERRKRELTLACLPRERYRNGFEPACSNGELAQLLASRCDALLCSDISEYAVQLAKQRCVKASNVTVEQRTMPEQWPDRQFDLIVISELAYYLKPHAWSDLVARAIEALTNDGTVLACHWTHPFEGATQSAAQAHDAFDTRRELTRLVCHEEADFLLDVWSKDGRPVAAQEGIL